MYRWGLSVGKQNIKKKRKNRNCGITNKSIWNENVLVGLSSISDIEENKSTKLVDKILEIMQTEIQKEKYLAKDGSLVTFVEVRDILMYVWLQFHKKTWKKLGHKNYLREKWPYILKIWL